MTLSDEIMLTLSKGLRRKSAVTCSRWATEFRIMGTPFPGPFGFQNHPWTKEMHDENGDWCGPKGAQIGFTETLLNRTFFVMDIKKINVLYLLPKRDPDASNFSSARFDSALQLSEHIANMFSKTNNVGHKKAGAVSLYVRGTQSKSAVKSVDVGLIAFDEYDEMNMENIAQAEERLSGQIYSQKIKISTPTAPNYGIDLAYKMSSQERYSFKCPCCSRWTDLTWEDKKNPECFVIGTDDPSNLEGLKKSFIKCKLCHSHLPHVTKKSWLSWERCKWVAQKQGAPERGFWVPQLYSTVLEPWKIARKYLLSLNDPAMEQEFWNSGMGMPHLVENARVSDEMINNILGDYDIDENLPGTNSLITMGVDQGKRIHYQIDQWFFPNGIGPDLNMLARKRTINAGFVLSFEQLDLLMKKYQVKCCVIDANPERRKAYEFSLRFPGYVYLCFYNRGISGKQINVNKDLSQVAVDRTSWLDLSIGRFHRGRNAVILPKNIPTEYKDHIKNIARIIRKDTDGNYVAKYVNTGDDHHAHTNNYSEIAMPLAVSAAENKDVGAFL